MIIREAKAGDEEALWEVLEPTIRAGESYALPRDWSQEDALAYWLSPGNTTFIVEDGGSILGTYYLKANQLGGGSHVGNCGFVTHPNARGRGLARLMAEHSLTAAKESGFRAMQFNFVLATNTVAIALWEKLGFEIIGRIPEGFEHPTHGLVDALIFHRNL